MTDFINQLTKKNQDYINIATRQLIKDGKTDEEIKTLLEEILPVIVEQQKKGLTARSIYGAPTVWAASKTEHLESNSVPEKPENANPWLMWLESSLFLLAWLGIINGTLNAFSNTAQVYGLSTLILISFSGGGVLYALYYFIYRHLGTKERPGWGKIIGIYAAVMLVWFLAIAVASLIPNALDPEFSGLGLVVVGALAFGARYLLKQKYNIKSALNSLSKNR